MASDRALASIHWKKSGSRISDTFTASARPAMASRRGRRDRKFTSQMTALGGTKVPRKFLALKALMPFFTPTPESFWLSTVVGTRMERRPRWVVAAAYPAASSTAPPPAISTYECRSMRWR